ncbi:two-component system sensor histidine kinase NtrB [Mariprofundus micogutta]|nr:ATP-binding protein [Mariprofundus micogutta]
MVLIVLSAEILVMLIFNHFHIETRLSEIQLAIADSLLLLLIAAYPALRWVIRPIIRAAQVSAAHTEMLAAALENAGESVIITDADCIMVHVNKAFEATTGYTFQQAVGRNPNMLQSGIQNSAFYERMWNALNHNGEWKGELWNRRADGSIYPEVLHIRAILDAQHELQYYIGTFSDISERLELEKAARQSQKMEALGTLVGGVAHNFNNILSGIIGKAYLAKKKSTSDAVQRHLDDIHQLGMDGSTLIRQLLSFSQDSTHDIQKIPFTTLLKATLKSLQSSMEEEIQVQTNFPEEELFVFGDAGQLQQSFVNLINNATDTLRNSEDKLIKVTLEERRCSVCPQSEACDSCNGHVVHLCVEDSGCGIHESEMEHIFDPFFTTKDEGTGLGLSMVEGAIKSHGGSIHAESKLNHGTTLTICLPLNNPNADSASHDEYHI